MTLPCPTDIIKLDEQAAALLTKRLFKLAAGPDLFKGPVLRAMTSRFNVWKWSTNNSLQHEFILKGNLKEFPEASPIAVETLLERATTSMRNTAMDVRGLYAESRGIKKDAFARDLRAMVAGKRSGKSYDQWMEGVAKAMRRGDVDVADPTVTKAAKLLRSEIDNTTKKLKSEGFLPEDVSPALAASYLSRRYNVTRIRGGFRNADGESFDDMLVRHFTETNQGKTPAQIKQLARDTSNKIQGLGDEQLEMNALVGHIVNGGDSKSFLKERVLMITDDELEPWLTTDALTTTYGFVNQGEALVAMTKKLKDMSEASGKPITSIADITKMLRDEAATIQEGIKAEGKLTGDALSAELNKVGLELKQAEKEILSQWDMVLGRFGTSNYPFLQRLRKLNSMAMLGGIALSSVPDMMMLVFKNGFGSVWRNSIPKTFKQMAAAKITRKQTENLVGVYDKQMNHILRAQTDPDFTTGGLPRGPVDRAIDSVSDTFTSATGINVWNRNIAQMGVELHSATLVDDMAELAKTGTLSKIKKARWARNGIGAKEYRIIQRNLKHSQDVDGATHANFGAWDEEAQELLARSILGDQTVLKPGRGDIPNLFQGDDAMRTVFQFKSFIAAAHNKIFLGGLQRAKIQGASGLVGSEAQGIMGLVSMGAAVYVLKTTLADRPVDYSLDNLIKEGIFRSGVGGMMAEAGAFIPGMGASSRFAGLRAQGMIGGPSLTQAARLVEVMHGIADGDISDKDMDKASRFVPFNNLFYLRGLFQALGD
jgi:hypothetical protein